MKKLAVRIIYPIAIFVIVTVFYFAYLLASNFTPRMYFYPHEVELVKSTPTLKRYTLYSDEDYLGIISLNQSLDLNPTTVSDLLFRIKEASQKDWLVENRYTASDLANQKDYAFGFPVEEHSKDKTYIMELELRCSKLSECSFNPEITTAVLRHYFSKSFYLKSPGKALSLATKKIYQNYIQQPLYKNVIIQLGPVVLYYLIVLSSIPQVITLRKKTVAFFRSNFNREDILILMIVMIDGFFQRTLLFYALAGVTVALVYLAKRPHTTRLLITKSILLYLTSFALSLVGLLNLASRTSLWSALFFFMLTGLLCFHLLVKPTPGKETSAK